MFGGTKIAKLMKSYKATGGFDMREANGEQWARHTDGWVAMQDKSRKLKEEADKLGKHGEERRQFLAERRKILFRPVG